MKGLITTNGLEAQVIFSHHAYERAAQRASLTEREVGEALIESKEFELTERQKAYKFSVYGMKALDMHYFYNSAMELVFNVIKKSSCFIVLTVVKKQYTTIEYVENGIKVTHRENHEKT